MIREYLKAAVCALLHEAGFDGADNKAMETLVEMLQSFISQVGSSSQDFCEHSGRAKPLPSDVLMALINMGFSIKGLEEHAFRARRSVLPAPPPSSQPKQPSMLQAGSKQPHPSYIPSHLPPFPDPHAYIRTPTHKKPVTEYEAIREKSACQKRDLERALNRYMTRIKPTESLFFNQENDVFPLIAAKPSFPPYLAALLPKDQVFENDEEEKPRPRKKIKATKEETEDEDAEDDDEEEEEEEEEPENSKTENEVIDNPYLRPVKDSVDWPNPNYLSVVNISKSITPTPTT